MSDAFLPGNGFDTYETQDKVLVSMDGTVDCGVVVRILQQQGFGVAGAVVQLAADQSAWAAAARQAAEALGIECIVLKAEALADQPAEVLGSGNDARFAALLTAADKLGIQYIATGHHARVELGSDGVHAVAAQLHPGVVAGGNILDAQLVGSGQQGGKPGVVAAAQYLGGLVCQCFCLQHDALDAESLGSLPCGCCPSALVSGQLHHSPGHAKALLLQNAHNNAAVHSAVHADKHLVLCFVGVEPVAGQKCVAHVPCLPPCALLCATASWSQRSFSGWPAWPFTQT